MTANARPAGVEGAFDGTRFLLSLAADVRELQHDVAALADALGVLLGEPFRSQARLIIDRRQTGAAAEEG